MVSYWDLLPFELKEYIISLASSQHRRDQRNENYVNVLNELHSYFTLRELWGLGHVKISYEHCGCPKDLFQSPRVCKSHLTFYGFYIDKKTTRKREIKIGRDSLERSRSSILSVKRRVLNGPFH